MLKRILVFTLISLTPQFSNAAESIGSIDQLDKVEKTPYVSFEYLIKDKMEPVGQIAASWLQAEYLSNGDVIYLKMNMPVSKGDRFTIYKNHGGVKVPGAAFSSKGTRVQLLGFVEIREVTEGVVVGKIYNAVEDINRGNWIAPLMNPKIKIAPQQPSQMIRGKVLSSASPNNLSGPYNFVFIDKGSADGLKVNDRLFVYRKGKKGPKIDEDLLPEVNVGELVVVDLGEHVATAYSMTSLDTFEAGATFKSAIPEVRYLDDARSTNEDLVGSSKSELPNQ